MSQPTTYATEPCGSCSAPVIWAVTINGHRMPVDEQPSEKGNLTLEPREPMPLVRVVNAHLHAGEELRTSHFVTCPQAPLWRKRPGAKR